MEYRSCANKLENNDFSFFAICTFKNYDNVYRNYLLYNGLFVKVIAPNFSKCMIILSALCLSAINSTDECEKLMKS